MKVGDAVAQKYVRRLLSNEHESLKWVWTIIMAGAFVEATIQMFRLLPCGYGAVQAFYEKIGLTLRSMPSTIEVQQEFCATHDMGIYSFGVFVVFMITFLRFYWGDNRLLDAKYKEIIGFLDDLTHDDTDEAGFFDDIFEKVLRNYTLRFVVLDAIFVIIHGIIIALLGLSVIDPYVFAYLYGALLLFNAVWLLIVSMLSVGFYGSFWDQFLERKELKGDLTAMLAPWRWMVNNVIHASVLIGLFALNEDSLVFLDREHSVLFWAILIMISNCVFDFLLTWNAYFPRVRSIYYDLISESADEARGRLSGREKSN